jgi:aspartyl-tRNA(Asn)/glutamyl-tRNA(Gln) amidotransferase subunit B
MEYDVIIGLEIHAELKTRSKMFCRCNNDAQGKEPNITVCPICMGHPGTLPYANRQAIDWTILVGLALHCQINRLSKFDRKNYFYPDLPKGYQISQYDLPFCYSGYMDVDSERIEITRIHLEEDTGKLTHPNGKNYSLVDQNRAGTPLIEMVTEPVIRDGATAKKFCQIYQQILRYLDISNADMEKGEMRCEANVSVQEKGKWEYKNGEIKAMGDYKLNPKIELKNINSFKAVEKAINHEISRQIGAIKEGERLVQETRGWDENKQVTFSQRVKETSADYRYFPEPDLPPINIDEEWIGRIKGRIIELPPEKINRFKNEYDMNQSDAELLASDKDLAAYAEAVISELRAWIDSTGDNWERQKKKLSKSATNWIISELLKHLNGNKACIKDIKVTPENFAELVCLIYKNKINSTAGQRILEQMFLHGGDPEILMKDLGLEQMDDHGELEQVIREIIGLNAAQAGEYRKGKSNVIQFFVGQVMSATKGKANPKIVLELLQKLLK